MDDSTIMATLKQDEELWFSQVIDRYTAYVTAIISGISKGALSASDIEEVAADVFFKLWQKRKQIRGDSMKAFIAKLARNASIDMMRKQGEPLVPYDDDILQVSYHEQPDELAILREQKQIIEQAVDAFCELYRAVFLVLLSGSRFDRRSFSICASMKRSSDMMSGTYLSLERMLSMAARAQTDFPVGEGMPRSFKASAIPPRLLPCK